MGDTLEIELDGKTWLVEKPDNLEDMWQAMGEDDLDEDERLPYWVEIWPSSLVLGRFIWSRREDLRGKVCLDLGCGLGLTALIGQKAGAAVLAMDYEFMALKYVRRNAEINASPLPWRVLMDWRNPAVAAGSLDVIWGGDIMYEKRFAPPLLKFMGHALAPGGCVYIAEPGRAIYSSFLDCLYSRRWTARKIHSEYADRGKKITVNIWELKRNS